MSIHQLNMYGMDMVEVAIERLKAFEPKEGYYVAFSGGKEVWEFIKEYNIRYCCLYDEGYTRLGCIGCPMAGRAEREAEFKRYPKYKENYIRAFQKMIDRFPSKRGWKTGEEVFEWWIHDGDYAGEEQMRIE